MSGKSHRLRWFTLGLGVALTFARYANGVAIRAGVYPKFTKSDDAKIKTQFRKEVDQFFKR